MSKLWVVGCSISHGVGVSLEQRWGDLVSRELGIDSVYLTAEGSSIEWAADQILRADIQADDVVCWGVTSPNRSLWYDDSGSEHHLLNVYYNHNPGFHIPREHLVDLNLAFKAVNYIIQVQRSLTRVGCRFLIGYMIPGLSKHREIILDRLSNTDNFVVMFDATRITTNPDSTFFSRSRPANMIFDDVGTDGMHPGPQQHQNYARQFLQNLKENT